VPELRALARDQLIRSLRLMYRITSHDAGAVQRFMNVSPQISLRADRYSISH
jgi:hypothetical protein